jgi:hypothetical protein
MTTGSTDERAGRLIDLSRHANFRLDVAALARDQIATARRNLDLSVAEFADVLSSLVGWTIPPGTVESWETDATPPGDVLVAASVAAQNAGTAIQPQTTDLIGQLIHDRFADVTAIYATRSEFTATYPPHTLLNGATDIRAAGLSLNVLCQQTADQHLRQLLEGGTRMRCLFLHPAGEAIKAREREEGHPPGRLSVLTDLNIQMLIRLREQLSDEARARLEIATYDQAIRFNILLIDQLCMVQPYMVSARGIDSPTFVIRRQRAAAGLYPAFEQSFAELWATGTPA